MILRSFLPKESLEKLAAYKYASGPATKFEKHIMQPFWDFAIEFVPMFIAPNLLTVIGLAASLLAFALAFNHAPTLSEICPRWVYAMTGFLILAYQTLDALDGKQARRTQSTSPLGTLFDHGCDILTTMALSYVTIIVGCGGATFTTFVSVVLSAQSLQWIWLWYEYHHNIFYSNPASHDGSVGVTEAQVMLIAACFLCGFFGNAPFTFNLKPYAPSVLKRILTAVGYSTFRTWDLFTLCTYYGNGRVFLKTTREGLARLPAASRQHALKQVCGFGVFVAFQGLFYKTTMVEFGISYWMCIVVMACVYSILSIRLLLSSVAKLEYVWIQPPAVPFYIAALASFLGNGRLFSLSREAMQTVVIVLMVYYIVILGNLAVRSVSDMASFLGIRVFVISKGRVV